MIHYLFDFFCGGRLDFDNVNARLNAFDDFLDICADRYEMDIVFVFVDVVAEYLLALFVDSIQVVDDNHFFLAVNRTLGLTEDFHFVSVVIDTLFFQIVDEKNIGLGDIGGF
jgi:hypothetical protein